MRGRHLTAACFLLLTSLCFSSQVARAGQPGEGPRSQRTQSWQEKVNSPGWVAIVGEVARPGTYETATTSSSLRDLLARAGGATEEASGNLQVIRRGRPGQHLFLSPNAEHPVYNGDVIVVEGRRNRGIGTGIELRNGRLVERKPEAGRIVWLAFARLIDRPVVVQMKSEFATPEEIVKGLEQAPELAARLEIISTSGQPGGHRSTGPRQIANGSVIVFPETGIDYTRIPSLPAAYKLNSSPVAETAPAAENSQKSGPALTVAPPEPMPTEQSAIDIRQAAGEETVLNPRPAGDSRVEMLPGPPEDLGQSALIPASPAAGPGTARDTTADSGLRRRVLPRVEPLQAPENSPMYAERSETPSRAAGTSAGSGNMSSATLAGSASSVDWLERITPSGRGTSDSGGPTPAEDSTSQETSLADLDENQTTEAATWSASTLVILTFGTLLSLGTFIVLWSMSGESESSSSQTETTTTPLRRDAGLEALIQNRVPLTIEPIVLPTSMEFYGRPQGTLKLRLEAGHSASAKGPHFATRTAPAKQEVHSAAERSSGSVQPAETEAAEAASPVTTADLPAGSTGARTAAAESGAVYRMDTAESSVPRPRSMAGTRSSGSRRAGLLDRVLATVHGASQK